MFRCVFLGRESDELTKYINKVKQAHRSIRADISRESPQML